MDQTTTTSPAQTLIGGMPPQPPTVGRIVHYVLTEEDAKAINRRRTHPESIAKRTTFKQWPSGAQAHIGPTAVAGEHLPMIVVACDPSDRHGVDGQVFLRGNDTLWVMSRAEGTEPGTWHWPERA